MIARRILIFAAALTLVSLKAVAKTYRSPVSQPVAEDPDTDTTDEGKGDSTRGSGEKTEDGN